MIYEVGKSWVEADARHGRGDRLPGVLRPRGAASGRAAAAAPTAGEENDLLYMPLGVGAVIPPWNFACAIMVGLTSRRSWRATRSSSSRRALRALVAARFVELLEEAGAARRRGELPARPRRRRSATRWSTHPLTRFISFTGSREVGLRINELRRQAAAGPEVDQARDPGDGRQGRDRRGRDRRPGRRRRRPSSPRPSASRGRSARPARAPSSSSASTISVLEKVVERARKLSVGDTDGSDQPTWGR